MAPVDIAILIVLLAENESDQETGQHEEDVHSQVSVVKDPPEPVQVVICNCLRIKGKTLVKFVREHVCVDQKDPKDGHESHAVKGC